MGGLVKLLGIERGTNTEGNTLAEKNIVRKSSNATVVDLGLRWCVSICATREFLKRSTYLDEGHGVQAVLGSDLEADCVAALGVPGGLGAGLNLAVDLVVVASGEDAQIVSGGDSSAISGGLEADSGAVAGNLGLLYIVTSRGTGEEALVADNGINVGSGALEEVKEGTAVEVGLLEVKVELGTPSLVGRQVVEDTLRLETLGQIISKLDLGLESAVGVPRLGEGQACSRPKH